MSDTIYAETVQKNETRENNNSEDFFRDPLGYLDEHSGIASFVTSVGTIGLVVTYFVKYLFDKKSETKNRNLTILSEVLGWIGDEDSRKLRNDIKNSYDEDKNTLCLQCIGDFGNRLRRLMVMYDRSWFIIGKDKEMVKIFYDLP